MKTDTTDPSYWLNWRFLLCATWILIGMTFSALLLWRFEGNNKSKNEVIGDRRESAGCYFKDDSWGTCWKSIHPIWLLAYRIIAFSSMLAILLAEAIIHNGGIFYFYTQWTFTLVTIYFVLASSLSVNGCLRYCCNVDKGRNCSVDLAERGSFVAPTLRENADSPNIPINLNQCHESSSQNSFVWGYALQIIFQMCAGAVVLTDSVFWLLIYPFLTPKDFRLSFLEVCMHSVNAFFLLGDMLLNRLRFPFFRIAYFVLWTCIFVIFQWIVHACVSIRWPYSFLELSSPYAPLWYLSIGLLHLPCFGVFALIFKIKRRCMSKYEILPS